MKLITLLILFASLTSLNWTANAADQKEHEDEDSSSFVCMNLKKATLKEFKKKMVETCNLNKPFTASRGDNLLESSYFFCCNRK